MLRAGRRGRRLSSAPQASTTVLLPHGVFSPVRSVLRRLAASLVVLVLVAAVVYVDRDGYRDAGGGSSAPSLSSRSPPARSTRNTPPTLLDEGRSPQGDRATFTQAERWPSGRAAQSPL